MIDTALLGTGGMMPLPNRFLTSLLVRKKGKMMLIDCGEGTQVTMKMLGWGFKNIDLICFTHFHADHIAGLPGLLLTIGNADRTEPLTLAGPKGLETIAEGLRLIAPELPFEIKYIELENENEEFSVGSFHVKALKVEHRVTCYAYSLEIPRAGKFMPEKAEALGIPKPCWSLLQKGETVGVNGVDYTWDMVLGEPRKGIKLCYCTDTRPTPAMPDFFRGADLLVYEGIYGENEKLDKAILHKHSLFREAAEIAKAADVNELWLTHFSPALTEPEEFIENARSIFPNTILGEDRMTKTIKFEDRNI
ncbi:MAG: ribonuclease Z [Firmicutes bacterium]|nr:ribonuclease Z [Bacillota bacterium]